MALVTCNGVAVISGSVIRPRVGVWAADLVLDQSDGTGFDPGTKVTIESEGGYELVGTVDPNRAGDFLDAVHVRILGGAAGMNKASTPRGYVQPHAFVRDVLDGIFGDAGETMSATTDAGLLAKNVAAWSILGTHPASWNLRALLGIVAPSMSWRVLADGTVWIGDESWPTATGTFDTIRYEPSEGSYLLGVEAPFVVPGTNLDGVGRVNLCVDTIEAGRLRTHVYVDMPSEGDRDIAETVGRMVKQATAGIDFFARYDCKVISQSADLTTVDVQPFGERNEKLLGGLQRVPVRAGTGIKIKFAPNARVLLGWDGGDPSKHFVTDGVSGETPLGIQLAGTHPSPLWDDFQTGTNALKDIITVIKAALNANCVNGAPLLLAASPSDLKITAFLAALTAGSYNSHIVSNG
jgi:hypothetical protein